MKRAILVASAVLLTMVLVQAASAQSRTPVVTDRQVAQQARIHQGVQSGELTRREARRLGAQQGKIQADKMIAKADGKVTPAERRHLRREQNRASRHIHRLKHNNRVRPS
jgi:aconitase B